MDRRVLPDDMRAELARPFGPIHQTEDLAPLLAGASCIVAVGDIVARTLLDLGLEPRLIVCDYKTQRGDEDPGLRQALEAYGDHQVEVDNPPGQISAEAWQAVRDAMMAEGTTRLAVRGEEDLVGLPAFLEAPDGAIVLYGAPGQGVVVVHVDGALRARAKELRDRMPTL